MCGETAAKGVRKARESARQNFWLKVAKAAKVLHPGEPKAAKVLTCQDWAKIAKVTHLSKPYRPPDRDPVRRGRNGTHRRAALSAAGHWNGNAQLMLFWGPVFGP